MTEPHHPDSTLELDGHSLTLDDVHRLLRGSTTAASIAPASLTRMAEAQALVEQVVEAGKPVYGINTGFGKLASTSIPKADLKQLQRNLVRSHACGVGEPLPLNIVRLIMLLRANSLTQGHSGVRAEVPNLLLAMIERHVTPWVPSQGSVGASGDLAPLSHIAVTLIGEGRAYWQGELIDAGDALKAAGLSPIELGPKEGLALINGTQVIQAIGLDALTRALRLMKLADLSCALTFEALRGNPSAYDARIGRLRPHPGHGLVASNLRAALQGSELHAKSLAEGKVRVQDPYSLRCAPQVHGAARDALNYVSDAMECELNSVTDNPLIFPENGDVISGGNFHGEPLAIPLDVLAIAVSELGSISERRIEQMVNPDLSRLPAFLSTNAGLNSGMMITHVAAAALASENKVHAHPASVDSIPTSANQEDHVSMGVTAALKARSVVANVERILEIELLCARYAMQFHQPTKLGALTQPAFELLAEAVDELKEDRLAYPDMEKVRAQIEREPFRKLLLQLD